MNKISFRKSLKVFAIMLLLTLAFVVLSSVVISSLYETLVVRYLKNYLDEHLLTELSMDDIRFKMLRGFPNATVEISNAVLLSGKEFSRKDFTGSYADTLLSAKSILLQFNLMKLLKKEYELKKIEVVLGTVNILYDKNNHNNLNVWKSTPGSGPARGLSLRNIVINHSWIRYASNKQKLSFNGLAEKAQFKGKLSKGILSGDVKGDLRIKNLTLKEKQFVNDASLLLDLNVVYSNERLRVSKGKMQLNKAEADIAGEFKGGEKSTIDLTLHIPKFGLNELMSIIPAETRFSTGDYIFSGNGKLDLVIKGSLADHEHLLMKSSFYLSDCTARNTRTKISMNHLNVNGSLTGTRSSDFNLDINSITAELGKGNFNGSISLKNLKTLMFRCELHTVLDLEALKDFAGIDSVEKMNGMVRSTFQATGSLKKLASDSSALALKFLENGTFAFEDVGIKLRNSSTSIEHISGKAIWGESVLLDSLSMRVNETDLIVSGEIQHLSGYFLKRNQLKSKLVITADNLDISKYLSHPVTKRSSTGYKSLSVFPANIYMKARVKAKNFTAGKFKASDVLIEMSALKDSVYLNHFTLKFPDGSIDGSALITLDDRRKLSVICQATPENINIQQLFYAFNNFTQHFIMDKNMKGSLNGNVNFYAQWDSALVLLPSSMKAQGDFQIINGELLQFEPMMKLSKYIDVEELKHIRFKTLKNSIYISDRVVYIPEMAINSTAFNISASGQHSFNNLFDYRIRVLLSEVLYNKARKKKKEMNEFLVEDNPADQTTIPLIIAGNPDNFDVRFDRKKAFGFKHDKKSGEPENIIKKPASDNFKIEWEDQEKISVEPKDKAEKGQSDIVIEWEE